MCVNIKVGRKKQILKNDRYRDFTKLSIFKNYLWPPLTEFNLASEILMPISQKYDFTKLFSFHILAQLHQ